MQGTIKSIFNEWSQALKIEKLKMDLSKVANDLTKIKESIVPQTSKTLAQAEKKYKEIVNKISLAQNQWNTEAKKAAVLLKKTSKEVETILVQYKKVVDKQKSDLKKSFTAKGKTASKGTLIVKKAKNALKVKTPVKTKTIIKTKTAVKTKPVVKVKAPVKAKKINTTSVATTEV